MDIFHNIWTNHKVTQVATFNSLMLMINNWQNWVNLNLIVMMMIQMKTLIIKISNLRKKYKKRKDKSILTKFDIWLYMYSLLFPNISIINLSCLIKSKINMYKSDKFASFLNYLYETAWNKFCYLIFFYLLVQIWIIILIWLIY